MIYISTSCIKNEFIWESVEQIALLGFKDIELSGGTNKNPMMNEKLLLLKDNFNLNYRCHNYFPPPSEHFVMNLASSSSTIYNSTINLIEESIELSNLLGANEYGFHAGFLTDITTSEIGKSVPGRELVDREHAIKIFIKGLKIVKNNNNIKLYVENNVVSRNNFNNFNQKNPFLITSHADVVEMNKKIEFNLLLDIAHLYVSANTLQKDFESEFKLLNSFTDYIHVSDNDGKSDENKPLKKGSNIYNALDKEDITRKTFTLEVNNDIDGLISTYELLEDLI